MENSPPGCLVHPTASLQPPTVIHAGLLEDLDLRAVQGGGKLAPLGGVEALQESREGEREPRQSAWHTCKNREGVSFCGRFSGQAAGRHTTSRCSRAGMAYSRLAGKAAEANLGAAGGKAARRSSGQWGCREQRVSSLGIASFHCSASMRDRVTCLSCSSHQSCFMRLLCLCSALPATLNLSLAELPTCTRGRSPGPGRDSHAAGRGCGW